MAWQIYKLTHSPLQIGLIGLVSCRATDHDVAVGWSVGRFDEPALYSSQLYVAVIAGPAIGDRQKCVMSAVGS